MYYIVAMVLVMYYIVAMVLVIILCVLYCSYGPGDYIVGIIL